MVSSWHDQHVMSHWPNVKPDAVRLLINHGADVMAQDENHSTPLHLAAFSGSTAIVRLLIEHGANITAQDRVHRTPLHMASSWDDTSGDRPLPDDENYNVKADTVRLLIDHGADVAAQDDTYSTPLHLASSYGSVETVRLLIERGADVTVQDGSHRTPLHMASSWEEGLINKKKQQRHEALLQVDQVKFINKADTVRLLIRHGADVMARDDTHSTPLHLASSKWSVETIEQLIEHGADVNAQNGNQSTPLHLAASSRLAVKGNVVRSLLKHGADIDAKDGEGRTPVQIASSEGHFWIAKLLLDHLASRR
ncbi:ankyrin repeat-containing domain protein [Lactarius pseudohatsudake]|nr:ankyrin repeat-containing domain protein [Lactarius pseudohatsudake]